MKKLSVLLLLLLFLSTGCSKDELPKLSLEKGELSQTVWKGTMKYVKIGDLRQIGISFITNNRGTFEIINNDPGFPNETIDDFLYEVEERRLYVKPSTSWLVRGHWLLLEKQKNKMVFTFHPESESECIISLNRVY